MARTKNNHKTVTPTLEKATTGIKGLDEIINGGLPKGRVSLVCGGPGCGKTLMAMEFLVHGAQDFGEPGVFMAFEETEEELAKNVASLGIDLNSLIERKQMLVDYVYIERSEIEETGVYDLEGLFVRLAYAIDSIGAKRVALDTIETLFSGFSDDGILRSELRRLFRWLKDRGITAVVTGERGEGSLTRYGLEEYVSDCVILLDNRIRDQISTRRLRVVKYRGSEHGSDEYPFLIDNQGVWVLPLSSATLDYETSGERISTGIPRLDDMLGAKGFYRGSTILVSGTAGSGKTSIAAHLVDATCRSGERCLYFAFEESPSQIIRNMRSIGLDLEQWVEQGLLQFHAARPSMYGIESHLLMMQNKVEKFDPSVVVVDPITNLIAVATNDEVRSMLVRFIDYLKMRLITTLFNSLTAGDEIEATTQLDISSLMDVWLLVRNLESDGERNRALYVLKARGMPHSNQVREFHLTDQGIELLDVHVSPKGVLTGSSRLAHEALLEAESLQRQQEIERQQRDLARRRKAMENQIADFQAELAAEEEDFRNMLRLEDLRRRALLKGRDGSDDAGQAGEPPASSSQPSQIRER